MEFKDISLFQRVLQPYSFEFSGYKIKQKILYAFKLRYYPGKYSGSA